MDEPIENLYFSWLCAKVFQVEVPTPSLTFWDLFRTLFSTEYVWLLSGDDNRCEDGLELRQEFLMEAGIHDESIIQAGCSIFEMLVGLSRRAEANTPESTAFWFWHLLTNLGLEEANDASNIPPEEIDRILYDFIWRNYDEYGRGGLFPMDHPQEDQREVELWYQFHEYLVDKDWPI